MGNMRKDPTRKKEYGRRDGLTLKEGKVRVQDTGKGFGRGSSKAAKPIKPMGRGV